MAMLEEEGSLSLTEQCELLSINLTSLYYRPKGVSARKLSILHRIDAIYTEFPYYGARRIAVILRREGYRIGRATVTKYMAEMELSAIYPKVNTSRANQEHKVYPYLLREITAQYPNHIWGTDITFIRMKGGFMYLVVYLDWFSRYIVSWELSDTLQDDFVICALERALQVARPKIVNSDQGSQYTGTRHVQMLSAASVSISMDGRGRALDNIFTERLWRTIKYEDIYIHDYQSPKELRQGVSAYIEHYNYRRPHQALGYKTPAEVYLSGAGPTDPDKLN
jgi:putative transposase